MMLSYERVSKRADRAIFSAEHPQNRSRQILLRLRRAGHRYHYFKARIGISHPDCRKRAERHPRRAHKIGVDMTAEPFVPALVPLDHLIQQEAYVERTVGR